MKDTAEVKRISYSYGHCHYQRNNKLRYFYMYGVIIPAMQMENNGDIAALNIKSKQL
jgi:hypothetical protein